MDSCMLMIFKSPDFLFINFLTTVGLFPLLLIIVIYQNNDAIKFDVMQNSARSVHPLMFQLIQIKIGKCQLYTVELRNNKTFGITIFSLSRSFIKEF